MKYVAKEVPDLPPLETLKTALTKHYKVYFWEKRNSTEGDQSNSEGFPPPFRYACFGSYFKMVGGKMSDWEQVL